MFRLSVRLAFVAASALGLQSSMAAADDTQTARGEYLVTIGGCNDCHTPGYFFGKPDSSRFLGGSDVGFEIPGQGVFVGRNITPDKETGIGSWTREQIVAALQTGQRPDGRLLAPIMPWHAFAQLTEEDVTSIAVFLQSLKPGQPSGPRTFQAGGEGFIFHVPDLARRGENRGCRTKIGAAPASEPYGSQHNRKFA